MNVRIFALAGLVALLGAAPAPSTVPARTATVICEHTPLYLWRTDDATPRKSGPAHPAQQGETFTIVDSRQSLLGDTFYKLNIPLVETGYGPDERYWIWSQCVAVNPQT